MHPSFKRRLVAVIILVWFLALGVTARYLAAPAAAAGMAQVTVGSGTPTDTSTATVTETATETASPTATPTPPLLVISQIYGGGGLTGATYQNDFVEIFNRGDIPVSLSGMSIQYASATGAGLFSANSALLSGSIPPGSYYLVELTSGTGTGTPLPPADATATAAINMATGGGKVILANDTAGLACNGISGTNVTPCSSSDLAKIIDLVGYGTANFFEGTGAAPAQSSLNTSADFRASNGCADTNNNGNDFSTATPAPRNSSSTPNYCVLTATPTDTPTSTNTVTSTATASDTPTATDTGTITDTPTITDTSTVTDTPTTTLTRTLTPTSVPTMAVVINEVAWGGTISSTDDEWIELYNSTGFPIDIAGWKLVAVDGTPSISLSGTIPGYGFFLLERPDDCTVSNVEADLLYSGALSNSGESLQLLAPKGTSGQFSVVDTANSNGGAWPAPLVAPFYYSMERRTGMADSDTAWIGNTGVVKNGQDSGTTPAGVTPDATCSTNTNKQPIYGTPKQVNWATMVTPTPSPTPTRTRTPTRTPYPVFSTSVSSHDFVVLNEFLPEPDSDWNQDGVSDTDDEYIEIINIGTTTVNLFGWKLDDGDPATPAYAIPGQLLSPGQRLAFFAFETGLDLSDGGGAVRLYLQSVVIDSYTYPAVTKADIAWCRLPDGTGGWIFGCVPTPEAPNQAASGGVPGPTELPPTPPGGEAPPPVSTLCLYQEEDYPPGVYTAECYLPGLGIWNPAYWDATSGIFGEQPYYPLYGKWEAYFE